MDEICFRSDMEVELVRHSARDSDVVFAARVSTQGARTLERIDDDDASEDEGLIRFLMRNRHGTPFEHNSMTFFVSAPIFVFREFMRHRIASYNEESGRYKQLAPTFYVPDENRQIIQVGKPGAYDFKPGSKSQYELISKEIRAVCSEAYTSYRSLLDAGVAREVARMVLPVTIYSSMYVTINARSLMNVLSLRTKSDDSHYPSYPQAEIEMVAAKMENLWTELMPITHKAFVAAGRVSP